MGYGSKMVQVLQKVPNPTNHTLNTSSETAGSTGFSTFIYFYMLLSMVKCIHRLKTSFCWQVSKIHQVCFRSSVAALC